MSLLNSSVFKSPFCPSLWTPLPIGIIFFILLSIFSKGIFLISSPNLAHNIPQPISTPIWNGLTLSVSGIVKPITIPFPIWVSGIILTFVFSVAFSFKIFCIRVYELSSISSANILQSLLYFPSNFIILFFLIILFY